MAVHIKRFKAQHVISTQPAWSAERVGQWMFQQPLKSKSPWINNTGQCFAPFAVNDEPNLRRAAETEHGVRWVFLWVFTIPWWSTLNTACTGGDSAVSNREADDVSFFLVSSGFAFCYIPRRAVAAWCRSRRVTRGTRLLLVTKTCCLPGCRKKNLELE